MPEKISIRPVDLLIDEQNPRLAKPNVGQREAHRALAHDQQKKLLVLAEDIVDYGLNPTELPIVMRMEGDVNRFTVLEGNRRLSALKALENPESLADSISESSLARLRKLSAKYSANPIDSVLCFVVNSPEQPEHWIELKHTGENQGAGTVPWDPNEASRYRARSGKLEAHQQALNYLESQGALTTEERHDIPSTTFRRLIDTPDVRARLGIEVIGGKLFLLADKKRVTKALMYVAKDLASGNTNVRDLDSREQRLAYAAALPESIAVKPTRQSGNGILASSVTDDKKPRANTKTVKPRPVRDRLIPGECLMTITEPRLSDIADELRQISIEKYKNCVSVLLRVFIELSVDCYIERIGLASSENDPLAKKIQNAADHLVSKRKLTGQQAKPVRRACQKDSFLAPSVTLMHNYVHNQHMFPGPTDLRAHWDNLQPFMVAIWTV